jgi:predicted RNA-binding Zn-ribbon protein involved in translation (DUF1610 family)
MEVFETIGIYTISNIMVFMSKSDYKYIVEGPFWTKIADFEQNGYYQLDSNTVPSTVDSNRNFKTIENAEKYFYEMLKKTCEDTLKDIICSKCGKLGHNYICDICGKPFCDDHLEWISFENGICIPTCEKCRPKLAPTLLLNDEAKSIREKYKIDSCGYEGEGGDILVSKRYEYIGCLEDLLKRPVLNNKYIDRI